MTVKDQIMSRFSGNLDRVQNIVGAYRSIAGTGKGRRSVQDTDLLRAAVVLLHATLEDLVRSLAEWKMPTANAAFLADLPLAGMKGNTKKFGMADLAGFRGQSVDEVVSESVREYLERSNYNHPGDLKIVLDTLGLSQTVVKPYESRLASMMTRRHWIVHRTDRNTFIGSGQHEARSLGISTVQNWIKNVEFFGQAVLTHF